MQSIFEQNQKFFDGSDIHLETEKIIELVEGTVNEMEDFLESNDLGVRDLEMIKHAEQQAKDRKNALKLLDSRIKEAQNKTYSNIEISNSRVEIAVGTVKTVIEPGEAPRLIVDTGGEQVDLEDLIDDHSEDRSGKLMAQDCVHYLGPGSPNSQVRELQPARQQDPPAPGSGSSNTGSSAQNSSPQQLSSSKDSNGENSSSSTRKDTEEPEPDNRSDPASDQKTPEEKLREELEEKYGKDDLEDKSLGELRELKDRLEKKRKLKNRLKDEYGLESEDITGRTLGELQELEESLKDKRELKKEIKDKFGVDPGDRSLEELLELEQDLMDKQHKKEDLKSRFDLSEKDLEGKDLQDLKDLEERMEKKEKLLNRLTSYGYGRDEIKDEELGSLEKKIEKVEKKKDLLEELDIDYSQQEINGFELDDLKSIKEEKEEREELIDELSEEGFDKDDLRSSSTSDLKKLYRDVFEKEEDTSRDEEYTDEEIDAMEKEAEEDLEMLKGAVKTQEKDEKGTDKKLRDRLEGWRKGFSDISVRGSSDDDGEDDEVILENKVLDLLEDYSSKTSDTEKAVKTAQVMKGYIEHKLKIERELTYKELAERIENVESSQNDEDLEILSEFFRDMAKQVYTGKLYVEDVDSVIEVSMRTVEGLSNAS